MVELNTTELVVTGSMVADVVMASAVADEAVALELAPKVIWMIDVEVKVVCDAPSVEVEEEVADRSETLTAGTIEALADEAGSTTTAEVEWLE